MTRLRAATDWIVALTVVAFVIVVAGAWQTAAAMQMGFIPARIGADAPGFVVPVSLTPLTATLVHGGSLHMVMNMIILVVCGRQAELAIGKAGLVLLYVLSAYGAALGQWLVDPGSTVPMIGASGAGAGVIAVYAMLFGRNDTGPKWGLPAHWIRAISLGGAWIGLQALTALAFNNQQLSIATAAHVGGFVAGLLLVRPLLRYRFRR